MSDVPPEVTSPATNDTPCPDWPLFSDSDFPVDFIPDGFRTPSPDPLAQPSAMLSTSNYASSDTSEQSDSPQFNWWNDLVQDMDSQDSSPAEVAPTPIHDQGQDVSSDVPPQTDTSSQHPNVAEPSLRDIFNMLGMEMPASTDGVEFQTFPSLLGVQTTPVASTSTSERSDLPQVDSQAPPQVDSQDPSQAQGVPTSIHGHDDHINSDAPLQTVSQDPNYASTFSDLDGFDLGMDTPASTVGVEVDFEAIFQSPLPPPWEAQPASVPSTSSNAAGSGTSDVSSSANIDSQASPQLDSQDPFQASISGTAEVIDSPLSPSQAPAQTDSENASQVASASPLSGTPSLAGITEPTNSPISVVVADYPSPPVNGQVPNPVSRNSSMSGFSGVSYSPRISASTPNAYNGPTIHSPAPVVYNPNAYNGLPASSLSRVPSVSGSSYSPRTNSPAATFYTGSPRSLSRSSTSSGNSQVFRSPQLGVLIPVHNTQTMRRIPSIMSRGITMPNGLQMPGSGTGSFTPVPVRPTVYGQPPHPGPSQPSALSRSTTMPNNLQVGQVSGAGSVAPSPVMTANHGQSPHPGPLPVLRSLSHSGAVSSNSTLIGNGNPVGFNGQGQFSLAGQTYSPQFSFTAPHPGPSTLSRTSSLPGNIGNGAPNNVQSAQYAQPYPQATFNSLHPNVSQNNSNFNGQSAPASSQHATAQSPCHAQPHPQALNVNSPQTNPRTPVYRAILPAPPGLSRSSSLPGTSQGFELPQTGGQPAPTRKRQPKSSKRSNLSKSYTVSDLQASNGAPMNPSAAPSFLNGQLPHPQLSQGSGSGSVAAASTPLHQSTGNPPGSKASLKRSRTLSSVGAHGENVNPNPANPRKKAKKLKAVPTDADLGLISLPPGTYEEILPTPFDPTWFPGVEVEEIMETFKITFESARHGGSRATPMQDCVLGVGLKDPDDLMYFGNETTAIKLVMMWPGYPKLGFSVPINIFSSDGKPLTRKELAVVIGSHYQHVFRACNSSQEEFFEPKNPRWLIGHGGYSWERIRLASVERVGGNYWQAEIVVVTDHDSPSQ